MIMPNNSGQQSPGVYKVTDFDGCFESNGISVRGIYHHAGEVHYTDWLASESDVCAAVAQAVRP